MVTVDQIDLGIEVLRPKSASCADRDYARFCVDVRWVM